jgi:hypothetical protein
MANDNDLFDYIWSTAVLGSQLGDPEWNVNVLTSKIRAATARRLAANAPVGDQATNLEEK